LPIRWRLTLFIALVIGVILILLGLALYFLSRSALLAGVEDTTRSRAHAVARIVEGGDGLDDVGDQEGYVFDGIFVIIRDSNGGVLKKVRVPAGTDTDAMSREALGTGNDVSGAAEISGKTYYVYAVPVNARDGSARVVVAGKSYEPAEESLETFGTILAAGIGTALLLSIVGAYFLAGAALRPVEDVSRAAGEMGEDDLSKRLPVANSGDEIGRLTIAINGLLSRLEAAFARREEALERQRRFAADASHELRTPLTSISGHARMMDEWAIEEDPERAKRSAGAIRREAGRMRNLIEALLALARGDEGAGIEVGRHDLGAVAEEAAQASQTAASGKVSVEYLPPDHQVEAVFDRELILRAASILLDNAVKYTHEGGSVVIQPGEEDGRAVLEVSDTGSGISEDQLPLIFERFHRADPSRSGDGAGLGLSIARQIAESHGGEIRAKSIPGEGSTFTLILPTQPRS